MSERTSFRLQIGAFLLLAVLFMAPHAINAVREGPHALVRIVTTDDGHYHARVKAALLSRYREASNGVTAGDPAAVSSAPAFLELLIGVLFGWTGLKAPVVMLLLTVFLTPLVIFPLTFLLRKLPLQPAQAVFWSFFYLLVFLGPLQKPVNMSLSLPFTIGALALLHGAWREGRRAWIVGAGILLGLAPLVYFWSFTYLWAFGGSLLFLHLFLPSSEEKRKGVRGLLLIGGMTLLAALPFFFDLLSASRSDPDFQVTAFRSTLIHSRGVESLPRALVLTALLAVTAFLVWKKREYPDSLFPLAAVLAAFIVMHQNFVHGLILSFSSHYYPFVTLSALLAAAWAFSHGRGSFARFAVVFLGSVFLLAGLWDYRASWDLLRGKYYVRDIQHLRPALEFLDDGTRETVLTDKVSAHMITSWTDDDVVFTAYIKHLFISNEEYAERYCLSELFAPGGPDFLWLGSEVTERKEPEKITEHAHAFERTCAPLLQNPTAALERYHVSWVLWNERLRPYDQPSLEGVMLHTQGEGWSLWKIQRVTPSGDEGRHADLRSWFVLRWAHHGTQFSPLLSLQSS